MGFYRNIQKQIEKDLESKFVFITGPRQVGKSTLAQSIIANKRGAYLYYEDDEDRTKIFEKQFLNQKWVGIDEFHKFKRWKIFIKGIYDKYHTSLHLLLTGSARLDVYQKSGDSLFGRYYLHHLFPLTIGELNSKTIMPPPDNAKEWLKSNNMATLVGLNELLRFSGFPEPFKLQSDTEHKRWSIARRKLLIREDLRDFTQIELIDLVENLYFLMPARVASTLSFQSLHEDIQVSIPTVQSWLRAFEYLYLTFRILPYTKRVNRSILKQPKVYLYDWSQIQDEGKRFENFIALHLKKAVQLWTDFGFGEFNLHFIRDRDHREVDFLITKNQEPYLLMEVKLAETQISGDLFFFSKKLNVPGIQIIQTSNVYRNNKEGLVVMSADRFLGSLP